MEARSKVEIRRSMVPGSRINVVGRMSSVGCRRSWWGRNGQAVENATVDGRNVEGIVRRRDSVHCSLPMSKSDFEREGAERRANETMEKGRRLEAS